MLDLDKNIEIVKEIVIKSRDLREEEFYKLIGIKQVQAIENVLKQLESYREDYNHRCQLAIDRKKELDTYKKVIDNAQEQIEIAEKKYDIEKLNPYAVGMYDAYKMVIEWAGFENCKDKIKSEQKSNNENYVYFVSYIVMKGRGFVYGNANIKTRYKISTYEDIKEIEEIILDQASNDCEQVIVQNFIQIS